MLRVARLLIFGLLVSSGMAVTACDDGPSTAPTPTPAPTPAPPPAPPPAAPAAIQSVTINFPTVRSQTRAEGTVTLTAAAPSGGAVVALESTNTDVVKVPSGITIAAGSTSGTFPIETSTVGTNTAITIGATYLGVRMTATINVTPPPLEPLFTVTSVSQGADICVVTDNNGTVDCRFDASMSNGFPIRFLWTLTQSGRTVSWNASDPVTAPPTDCNLLGGGSISNGSIPMDVTLRVRDRNDALSGSLTRTVRVFPQGNCGY